MNPPPPRTTGRQSPPFLPWRLLLLLPLLSLVSTANARSHLRRRTYTQTMSKSSSLSLRRWLQTAGGNEIPDVGNTTETTLESSSATNETMSHSPAADAATENDNEDAKVSSLEALESELSALQNTDDESLTNKEFVAKMEKEQELEQEEEEALESLLEEGVVGVWDDEYNDDDAAGDDFGGVMNVDELKEELNEVNQEIAELDEQSDDGEGAQDKEAFKEELTNIKYDLEEVINEGSESGDDDGYEVYRPGQNSSVSTAKAANMTVTGMDSVMLGGPDSLPPNIHIDPTLTMDLTQYNTPSDNAPKEAFSSEEGTSNMDNEVDRHGVNGTLPGELEIVNEDSEVSVEKSASATASAGVENNSDDESQLQNTSEDSLTKEAASIAASSGVGINDDVDDIPSLSYPVKNWTEEASNKTVSWMEEIKDDDILPPPTNAGQSVSGETPEEDDDDYVPLQSASESVTHTAVNTTQDNLGHISETALNSTVPVVGTESVLNTTWTTLHDNAGNPVVSSGSVTNKTVNAIQDSSTNELDSALNSTLPMVAENSAVILDDEEDQHGPPELTNARGNDANASTSSAEGVEVGVRPNENDDDEALDASSSNEAVVQKNTTSAIPSKNAGPKDDVLGNEILDVVNSTVTNPTESMIVPTNTGVATVQETTESTASGSTTTTSQTPMTETTSAAAVTTPAVTSQPPLNEVIVSTQATPSPTPSPTYYPTKDQEPNGATLKPTYTYVEPTDDSLDPVVSEQNVIENEAFSNGEVSTPTTSGGRDVDDFLREEEKEVKKVGGWMGFAAIVLMIYTAYQMSENPDGICASLCRLVITILGCIVKIMLIPFRYILGGGRSTSGQYMATPSYRDPYGSRHMELT